MFLFCLFIVTRKAEDTSIYSEHLNIVRCLIPLAARFLLTTKVSIMKNILSTPAVLFLAVGLLVSTPSAFAKSASSSVKGNATSKAGSKAKAGQKTVDYVRVLAKHSEKNPKDPVVVGFSKYKVEKAVFDPKSIAGGSATLSIDVTSLSSGIGKRDKHLATTDFLNTAKNAKAKVAVSDVKATKTPGIFSAKAKVSFGGISQTWPVTLKVVAKTKTSVTVMATHTFLRSDFKVGEKGGPVAPQLIAEARITLRK